MSSPSLSNPHPIPSEVTPLLTSSDTPTCDHTEEVVPKDGHPKGCVESAGGMPKFQIILLSYARAMEPLAFVCVFPYVSQMVKRNGTLADSDIGFYSGLIESIFTASQAVALVFWSRLADRFGRKRILVCSLIGMTIGPVLFGLTSTIWQMMIVRCITGMFSGANFLIRTMIGELCSGQDQARAFSWYSFAATIGGLLGPVFGAALVDPVSQYPVFFGGMSFFKQYPYALPGLAIGTITATAAVSSAMFLEETLVKMPGESDVEVVERTREETSVWKLLKDPKIFVALLMLVYIVQIDYSYMALTPIMLYTPVAMGGLGLSTSNISLFVVVNGIFEASWLLVGFPYLHRQLKTRGVLKLCAIVIPIFFAGHILMNAFLRLNSQRGNLFFLLTAAPVSIIGPGVWMSLTGAQLALNQVAPNARAMGKLNSVAESLSSVMKSIVPPASTAIFALGVRNQIIFGYLAWVILIILTMSMRPVMRWFPNT